MKDITSFLQKFDPDIPIVGYVTGAEREVLNQVSKHLKREIFLLSEDHKSLTSKGALAEFSFLLREKFQNLSPMKVEDQTLRFLKAVADFQFGEGVGDILFTENISIYGRKELGFKVSRNNQHLVTFNPSRGLLNLSLQAASLMYEEALNKVIFDGEKIEGSTIFAKGIIEASSDIRAGDEVIILNSKGIIIGIGTSYLSGEVLKIMQKGKGISIRKKVK